MGKPAYLYKYEAFSIQSLLNLKRQIIYFSSPSNFNDPYDCAVTPAIDSPSDEELQLLRQMCAKDERIAPKARNDFEAKSDSAVRKILVDATREAIDRGIQRFLQTNGVACFSKKNCDLLMWSHYGGHYKGFCLEFATALDPQIEFREVHYVPSPPHLNVKSILLDDDFQIVKELFCTKSETWAYEEEWRAIHQVGGTQHVYSPEMLTGVYFGPDIDSQAREIVCLILAGQNDTARLWKGSRSTTEFRVLFEEIKYMPHLVAKRNGLIASGTS